MAFDNLSLKIITDELKTQLDGATFGKPLSITPTDFAFPYSFDNADGTFRHGTFIFSLNSTSPFITYSFDRYEKLDNNTPFFNSLKKLIYAKVKRIEKLAGERIVTISFDSNHNDLSETNVGYDLIIELFPNHPNAYLIAYPYGKIISLYKEKTNLEKGIFLTRNASYTYPPSRQIDLSKINDVEDVKPFFSNACYKRLVENAKTQPLCEILDAMLSSHELYLSGKDILPYNFADSTLKKIKPSEIYSQLVSDQKKLAKLDKVKELITLIEKSIKVVRKKQKNLQKDLETAKDHLKFLEYGQMIYLYQAEIKKGDKVLNRDGYSIPLNPLFNAAQNANSYFKKYQKAKSAIEILSSLIIKARDEATYLDKKLMEIKDGSPRDLLELKSELLHEGYIKEKQGRHTIKEVSKRRTYDPHYLVLTNGKIGFGMNGLQNEDLTFKIAKKDDIFIHVKDYPGSHIVVLDGKEDEEVLHIAYELALYLSHLDSGTVMIARKKDVKKNPEKIGLVNILKYETKEIKYIRSSSISLFQKALKG